MKTCKWCGEEVDEEMCYCGVPIDEHTGYENHGPVPIGCVCGYRAGEKEARRCRQEREEKKQEEEIRKVRCQSTWYEYAKYIFPIWRQKQIHHRKR